MTRTTDTEPQSGQPSSEGMEASAPSRLPEPTMTREHVLKLLQAEVDRHRPLEDKRRAAAILAETSIRFVDGPERKGFIIAGPNGEPRTIVRDGQTVPFTLQDLAAEVRRKYPALFHSDEPANPVLAIEALPAERSAPPRDWLIVRSGEHGDGLPADPPLPQDSATEQPETGPAIERAIAPDTREILTPEHPRDALSSSPAEPSHPNRDLHSLPDVTSRADDPNPTIPLTRNASIWASFRPSYALYAGAALAACTFALFIFSGQRLDAPTKDATTQQAGSGPQPGPTGTGPVVAGPPVTQPARPRDAIAGSAEVVDTSTLRVDGKVVRLFGVEWARGGDAENLTRYIAGREVVCTPAVRPDRHRCQVEGRDLSEVVLFNGGGRATLEATPELKAAEAQARAAGYGVWQKP